MEDLVTGAGGFWKGRRVFLTGHTGFKGGWLALWLAHLGAEVRGYSLDPWTDPNLFTAARVGDVVDDVRGDIRDAAKLNRLDARVSSRGSLPSGGSAAGALLV